MAFLFGLQDTLLDFFEKGGGVVLFIGLLIILMWSFILERFWYFKYIHSDVSGNYKAMIYCSSTEEAKNIIDQINPTLKEHVKIKPSIKRGCSEFYNLFPNFKEIDELDKNYMVYNSDWKKIEENMKIKKNYNKIKLSNSVPGLSIADFLIIIQWLNYARKINDSTYKDIDIDFFNSEFIDYKLSNQVELRKKQFIIPS